MFCLTYRKDFVATHFIIVMDLTDRNFGYLTFSSSSLGNEILQLTFHRLTHLNPTNQQLACKMVQSVLSVLKTQIPSLQSPKLKSNRTFSLSLCLFSFVESRTHTQRFSNNLLYPKANYQV